MATQAELHNERVALAKADFDIERGEERVARQRGVHAALAAGGHDTPQARDLCRLLEQTLENWKEHRKLILQRIAYLEFKPRLDAGLAINAAVRRAVITSLG